MPDTDYGPVVQIDEHNLDKECINLPSQYLKFAHRAAEAKRDADEAESELKVVTADMANAIRANPSEFGIDKVTETGIASAVLTTNRVKKAQKAARESRHASEMAQAVVWALEHKKRSLTLLVELHGMGYFSNPKVSAKGKEAVEDMTKRRVRRAGWED